MTVLAVSPVLPLICCMDLRARHATLGLDFL